MREYKADDGTENIEAILKHFLDTRSRYIEFAPNSDVYNRLHFEEAVPESKYRFVNVISSKYNTSDSLDIPKTIVNHVNLNVTPLQDMFYLIRYLNKARAVTFVDRENDVICSFPRAHDLSKLIQDDISLVEPSLVLKPLHLEVLKFIIRITGYDILSASRDIDFPTPPLAKSLRFTVTPALLSEHLPTITLTHFRNSVEYLESVGILPIYSDGKEDEFVIGYLLHDGNYGLPFIPTLSLIAQPSLVSSYTVTPNRIAAISHNSILIG